MGVVKRFFGRQGRCNRGLNMSGRLKIVDENDNNFAGIKRNGFYGVIFTEKSADAEELKAARSKRLKTFVLIRGLDKEKCFYLEPSGVKEGELYAVTLKTVKKAVKSLNKLLDLIDGFIIPIPCLKGLLWNEAFPMVYEDFCGADIKEDMPAMFDKYEENVDFRIWYYNIAAKALFLDYILPVSEYLAALGKRPCLNFGHMHKSIDFIKKQVNPFWAQKKRISAVYEAEDGIIISQSIKENKKNLLVLPLRALMRSYAYGAVYSRQESAFTVALAEEEYYKNSLDKCSIEYRVADEAAFSAMKLSELRKFENIVICDACVLSKKDTDMIQALKNEGYNVNARAFLDILDKAN